MQESCGLPGQIALQKALRDRLGEIVDRARLAGQPTVITRQGRVAAIVVSAYWYSDALGYIELTLNHYRDREDIRVVVDALRELAARSADRRPGRGQEHM